MGEILIAASADLDGEQAGGHKRNAFLLDELTPYVRFVPV